MGFLFLDLYLPPPLPASASSHTTSSHTTLSHTHTIFVTASTHHHLATSTVVSRGRRGTWRSWRHPPSFCVAGVVLMTLGWVWWRAWSPLVARDAAAPLCVAGVALGDIHLRFAWQRWYLWRLAGSCHALGPRWYPVTPLHFAWQAWHLATSFCVAGGPRWSPATPCHFAWQAWHMVTSTVALRGRGGAWRRPPSFCVAGVEHMTLGWVWWRAWSPLVARDAAPPRHFAWQAWHLVTPTVVSHGRSGTWRHPPSFCVAEVVLVTLGWVWWRAWSPLVARDAALLCVAGVALGDIHRRFMWQAWRLATSTFVLRGRRGTYDTWLGLVTRLVPVGCPWRRAALRGRRGTWWHPPPFCVAGVALGDIHRHFAWPSFTHNFVTHTTLSHTHKFVTHHLSHTSLSHTIFHAQLFHAPSLSHTIFHTHLLSHTSLSHTSLSHTFFHTPLCHTPSFTHHFVTHLLSHTTLSHETLSHTFFHTQLCHIPSFTHIFVTHTHTPSFTHHFVTHLLSHTALSHTFFDTPLCHTPSGTHNFVTPSFPHTTLSHTLHCVTPNFVLHNFVTHNCSHTTFRSILHHLLCLSFLPRPAWTFCVCLLEEVDLWGYPVL